MTGILTKILALSAIAFAATSTSLSAGQTARKSVWDGVYSEEQAARGQKTYTRACSYCHRDNLSGGGGDLGAPPLGGVPFFVRWETQTVRDLFETIATTMPLDRPGTLSPQEAIDVVSFLLRSNKLPSGAEDLRAEPAALSAIEITEKPPGTRQ